jgi:exopolyphosphatase/pppGpp-phosphohydrolase
MNSVDNNQNFAEMVTVIKEMLKSIGELVDELKLTVGSSKKSGTIGNAKEIMREASSIYNNITDRHGNGPT